MNSLKDLNDLKEIFSKKQPCFGKHQKNSINCSFCSRIEDQVWHWCTVYTYEIKEYVTI